MARMSLPVWAEAFQIGLSLLFALAPVGAIAYVDATAPAGGIVVAHHLHEFAIAVAVLLALFLAYLAYRCHMDGGEPLTRHLALGFLGFAVLYAPHGVLTFAAHDQPALFLLWGPASRLVMGLYVLRGLLAPRDRCAVTRGRAWLPDLIGLAGTFLLVGWLAAFQAQWFPTARVAMEAAAAIISLVGLAVLIATRARGPILWFHAVALCWFALASTAFLLSTPWQPQWWLAHAISGAGFLLLGRGVAHVFRTSQSFSGFFSPERLFWLLSDAERMAAELREAKDASERSIQTKATFLAAASHDLRQPAQALVLFTAALRARLENGQPALDILPHMDEATTALQSILDGLLDVSRLDAGMVSANPSNVAVGPILAEATDQIRARAGAKGLTVTAEDSLLVAHADGALLRRLVSNLVDNAIKYTARGGIELSACLSAGQVRISVADTGPGIPEHLRDAIFEEFVQLDNPERDRGKGLGLGLAIVRRLASLMSGRVGVNNRQGAGAVFWVDLPAAGTDTRAAG